MSAEPTPSDRLGYGGRPELKLLEGAGETPARAAEAALGPKLRLVLAEERLSAPSGIPTPEGPRILIAGGDQQRREEVRRELAGTLPAETRCAEASRVWEVLQQAPHSGVVMLTGALKDASMGALVSLLEHRHPRLPIVVLEPEPHAEKREPFAAAAPDPAGPRKD